MGIACEADCLLHRTGLRMLLLNSPAWEQSVGGLCRSLHQSVTSLGKSRAETVGPEQHRGRWGWVHAPHGHWDAEPRHRRPQPSAGLHLRFWANQMALWGESWHQCIFEAPHVILSIARLTNHWFLGLF